MATSSDSNPSYTPALIIILIIGAFFLGSLITKVQYLEKGGTTQPQVAGATAPQNQPSQPPAITKDTIKQWAKEIGLNTNQFNSCFDSAKYKSQVDKDAADGQTAGVNGTPTLFMNGHAIIGAQPFNVFKDAIDFELNGGDWNNPTETVKYLVDSNPNNGELDKNKTVVDIGRLPVLGNKNAKVTIIEFSDFECPFCRRFFAETYPKIKKEYIDTGKVALYYRHFPLPFHPLAQPFAQATECANEQGKFWQLHDKVFTSQG